MYQMAYPLPYSPPPPSIQIAAFPTSLINSTLLGQRLSASEYQDEVEKIFASLLSARFAVLPSADEYFLVENPIITGFQLQCHHLNTLQFL